MHVELLTVAIIILAPICARTIAYAAYQKRQGNIFGAVGLIVLGVLALALPMVVIWMRF